VDFKAFSPTWCYGTIVIRQLINIHTQLCSTERWGRYCVRLVSLFNFLTQLKWKTRDSYGWVSVVCRSLYSPFSPSENFNDGGYETVRNTCVVRNFIGGLEVPSWLLLVRCSAVHACEKSELLPHWTLPHRLLPREPHIQLCICLNTSQRELENWNEL
jgi:hypothetical protein